MIKNIVFDLGGVIIDFNPEKILGNFFPDASDVDLITQKVFRSKAWNDMDRGTADVEALVRFACEQLPVRMHKIITHLLKYWWDYMLPIPEMYHLVKSLKENGYKIYLLSNTPNKFYDYVPLIPALSYFDGFLASCDYNLLKPEPEIFQTLFEKFSLNPSECFFVDDMRKNTDSAQSLGMKVFCHEKGDVDLLRTALKNEGINC